MIIIVCLLLVIFNEKIFNFKNLQGFVYFDKIFIMKVIQLKIKVGLIIELVDFL